MWCVAEFASALSIKQCTGQVDAAVLTLDAASGLRAGAAPHLAAALDAKAKSMATLDDVLAKNAKRMKLKLVAL